jgi:preprotein translocase subunit SecA
MAFWKVLLGDPNKKGLDKIQNIVEEINNLEPKFEKFSDEDLTEETQKLKNIIKEKRKEQNIPEDSISDLGKEKIREIQKKEQKILDDILPIGAALVRETAKRTLKQRHFDVQLMGGIVLHQGKISEMKTGEGKTLTATVPLFLNALLGRGAHLITVNDYLAKIHTQWMGQIYNFLGLSVGCIQHEKSYLFEKESKEVEFGEEFNLKSCSRKEAYDADITYGTNNEFGFDYLRDNMVSDIKQCAQRDLYFAIVDEVDSILIDEARTPLIISAPAEESAELYKKFSQFVPNLKEEEDYNKDEKMQAVTLTDEGMKKAEQFLNIKNLYEEGGVQLIHHLEEALRAETLFKKDRDYVVKDGEVVIVDQFTGRLMPGRRYSEGLHQAIEAKENVEIQKESVTLATISFQNLFRMYAKLSGMTGTAVTEEEEFYKIYGLEVLVIPTNKPMIREDLSDRIYKNETGKFMAVVSEIKERYEKGQPVLVGTIAIEKSELLSEMLKAEGIPHSVLNAKFHEKEAKIIAQAGRFGAVTVATNMAGRGVDIILGGTPTDEKEHKKVIKAGGLHILGTERHEARRIDNQLRGRAGRQGDPGSSQFYVSMEDDLMRIFGGEKIKNVMEMLKLPEDQPVENSLISRSLESSQKRVEGYNFDLRKQLVEYDDVMNKHRETIYRRRRSILIHKNLKDEILKLINDNLEKMVSIHTIGPISDWNWKEIIETMKAILGDNYSEKFESEIKKSINANELAEILKTIIETVYSEREKNIGDLQMRAVEKAIYLRTIDTLWIEHLTHMEYLREGIGLRGLGQRDPLVEYKREAYNMFERLMFSITEQVTGMIFRVEISQGPQGGTEMPSQISMQGASEQDAAGVFNKVQKNPSAIEKEAATRNIGVKSAEKVGRNDPCPCGSGKKYKKCCGKFK